MGAGGGRRSAQRWQVPDQLPATPLLPPLPSPPQATCYLNKLPPSFTAEDRILVSDPMLATGARSLLTIATRLQFLVCGVRWGAGSVRLQGAGWRWRAGRCCDLAVACRDICAASTRHRRPGVACFLRRRVRFTPLRASRPAPCCALARPAPSRRHAGPGAGRPGGPRRGAGDDSRGQVGWVGRARTPAARPPPLHPAGGINASPFHACPPAQTVARRWCPSHHRRAASPPPHGPPAAWCARRPRSRCWARSTRASRSTPP